MSVTNLQITKKEKIKEIKYLFNMFLKCYQSNFTISIVVKFVIILVFLFSQICQEVSKF